MLLFTPYRSSAFYEPVQANSLVPFSLVQPGDELTLSHQTFLRMST